MARFSFVKSGNNIFKNTDKIKKRTSEQLFISPTSITLEYKKVCIQIKRTYIYNFKFLLDNPKPGSRDMTFFILTKYVLY